MILLNPGPVTLSARVRQAIAGPDVCHREPEFAALTRRLILGLAAVYPDARDAYTAVLMTVSGTGAVEAMLSTFAERHTATLVASNGVYGERMAEMLARQGKPHVHVRAPWTSALSVSDIRDALDAAPDVRRLAVVHHETTTGRLNDLGPIADLCRQRDVGLLVDGVSSFGGESLPMAGGAPLAVAATAGKCLHAVPGLSFVLCRADALAAHAGVSSSLYLDLVRYAADQREGWSPFTQAVQGCFALEAALAELEEQGGWRARHARYAAIASAVRGTLRACGVEPLLGDDETSAVLHAYRLPAGDSYARIHDALKDRGFVIYAGQGDLGRSIFRIAHMGAIADADVERLLAALRDTFGEHGHAAH